MKIKIPVRHVIIETMEPEFVEPNERNKSAKKLFRWLKENCDEDFFEDLRERFIDELQFS